MPLNVTTTEEERLFAHFGPLIGGPDLVRVAGFRSSQALKMAALRGRLGFRTFTLEGRRGRFARTEEVATWLRGLAMTTPNT